MLILIVPISLILLQSSRISCQLSPRFIDGSLSQPININIALYSTHLKGTVLYLVDYNRNNLLINIDKFSNSKTASVSIRYNEEIRTTTMLAMCGCDPCDARMINFHVTSTITNWNVLCNNHGQQIVPRKHTISRNNNRLPKALREIMDRASTTTIYLSILLKEIGCLNSFEYNHQKVLFNRNGTKFLPTCPRACNPDECNGGQCQPSYLIGPFCDCSKTWLGGPYCNHSMQEYDHKSRQTYAKVRLNNELNIKMYWKPKSLKNKYCLLNFVHQYGRVTFSTHQTFLLKDADLLTTIYSDRINSLDVDITGHDVKMKVNNKSLPVRPALIGNLTIHVGFTEKLEQCDTFEGKYYFLYNPSQLRLKPNAAVADVSAQWSKENKIILYFVPLGLIVMFGVPIMVYIKLKRKGEQMEVLDPDNISKPINLYQINNTFEKSKEDDGYEKISESGSNCILNATQEDTYEHPRTKEGSNTDDIVYISPF